MPEVLGHHTPARPPSPGQVLVHAFALLLGAAQDLRGATRLKDRIQPGGQGPQERLAAAPVGPAI